MLIPCGTVFSSMAEGVAGVGASGTDIRLEGPALLPELLRASTVYTAKSAELERSTSVSGSLKISVRAWDDLVLGGNASSPATEVVERSLVNRWITNFPGLRINAPSVVLSGAVQVSVTLSPFRMA